MVDPPAEQERRLGVLLFTVLQALTGQTPAWGIITGVHPVKLLRQKSEEVGLLAAEEFFRDKWLVSDEKIALMRRVLQIQEPYVALNQPNSCSLYLSVPFCPSRCSYCSFISQAVEGAKKLVEPYVTLLLREIEETAAIARQVGLQIQSVYMGGGTPTTFSASQLTAVIEKVREQFDLSHCVEFTVEAGRPDTVTKEKLQALLNGGVTRISINPQSMHDDVLRAIGRRHTVADTLRAFSLARDMGFDNINMDLIAGLPLDTPGKIPPDAKGYRRAVPRKRDGAHPRLKTRGPDDAGRRSAGKTTAGAKPPGRWWKTPGGRSPGRGTRPITCTAKAAWPGIWKTPAGAGRGRNAFITSSPWTKSTRC